MPTSNIPTATAGEIVAEGILGNPDLERFRRADSRPACPSPDLWSKPISMLNLRERQDADRQAEVGDGGESVAGAVQLNRKVHVGCDMDQLVRLDIG